MRKCKMWTEEEIQFLKFAYPNSEFTFNEITRVLNRSRGSVVSKAATLKLNRPLPETLPDGYKRCTKCKVIAPFDYFYRDKTNKKGMHGWCKECHKTYKNGKLNLKQENDLKEEISFKKCTKCKEIKPLNEFYKQSKSKDGYAYQCKDCRRIMKRKYTITGGY